MLPRTSFRKKNYAFDLSDISIDQISEWLATNLSNSGVDKRDCLRMRLLLEETLLNMAEHYGAEQKGAACLEKKHGSFQLRLTVDGERFNPLKPNANNDEWSVSLFSVIDMRIQYSYSMGANIVRMSLPHLPRNPVLTIGIAILAGALIGMLGNVLIPDALQEAFCDTVLTPISNMWVRLLQTISGPAIFLTALTAALDTKRIANTGGSRFSTLIRYFAISAAVVIFTVICSLYFFPLDIATTRADRYFLSNTLNGILQIIPSNLVEPFSTANTPQLLLIAIVTGYLFATAEGQVGELKTIFQQLNILGMTVAKLACSLVPFFVGLLLCLRIWTHDNSLLGTLWVPLLLSSAITVFAFLAVLLIASAQFRVNPILLAQKVRTPFWEALKRGVLDFTTIDSLALSCEKQLGIESDFARATLPLGLFLYMPTSGIGICVFVLFAAQTQQVSVDQAWLISAAVVSVVLAVATPPVTGANLLSFVMAFQYLNIPNDAFLDVMVFDIVFGVLCVAFDQTMLQIETITQANRMGFLNEKVLRAPIDTTY